MKPENPPNSELLKSMISSRLPQRPKLPPEPVGGFAAQGPESLSHQIGNLAQGARKRSMAQLLRSADSLPQSSSPLNELKNTEEKNDPIYLDTSIRKNLGLLVQTLIQADKKKHLALILKEHQQFINDVINLISDSNQPKS